MPEKREAAALLSRLEQLVSGYAKPLSLMEVCGTHTVAVFRSGLRGLLPPGLRLLSGPGCPVCVTPQSYIDTAVALARESGAIVATFGDMLKVPGSGTSLERERAAGGRVRVVYCAMDALEMARKNPAERVVLLGVGFETTAPTVAAALSAARAEGLKNFLVLSGHKLIPPAMKVLAEKKEASIDGFMCPGHVSVVIGSGPYETIAGDCGKPCVIAGFEPLDILRALTMLCEQVVAARSAVEIQYRRVVTREGNRKAVSLMEEVFEAGESAWRGLGRVPESGLSIREDFADFDAALRLKIDEEESETDPRCACGDVLAGIKDPTGCPLFGGECSPESPVGPCMVSSEGACAAFLRYAARAAKKNE